MLGHDAVDDAEPEIGRGHRTRTARRIRLEHPRARVGIEAGAVVAHLDAGKPLVGAQDGRSLDPHPACAAVKRREGARAEVRDHLTNRICIAEHLADVRVDLDGKLHGGRRRTPKKLDRRAKGGRERHELDHSLAAPRDREHLLHELAGAARRRADVLQHLLHAPVELDAALEHLGVEQDRPEEVVEVLGDAGCEHADRLHLLPLAERLVEATARDRKSERVRKRPEHRSLADVERAMAGVARLVRQHAPQRAFDHHGLEYRRVPRVCEGDLHRLPRREPLALGVGRRRQPRRVRPGRAEQGLPGEFDRLRVSGLCTRDFEERERSGVERAADHREHGVRGRTPVELAEQALGGAVRGDQERSAALVLVRRHDAGVGEAREVGEERESLAMTRRIRRAPRAREPDGSDHHAIDADRQVHARQDLLAVRRLGHTRTLRLFPRVADIDDPAGAQHEAGMARVRGPLSRGALFLGESLRVHEPQLSGVRVEEVDARVLDLEELVGDLLDRLAKFAQRADLRKRPRNAAVDLVALEEPAVHLDELVERQPSGDRLGDVRRRVAEPVEHRVGRGSVAKGEERMAMQAELDLHDARGRGLVSERAVPRPLEGAITELAKRLVRVDLVDGGARRTHANEPRLAVRTVAPEPDLARLASRRLRQRHGRPSGEHDEAFLSRGSGRKDGVEVRHGSDGLR